MSEGAGECLIATANAEIAVCEGTGGDRSPASWMRGCFLIWMIVAGRGGAGPGKARQGKAGQGEVG